MPFATAPGLTWPGQRIIAGARKPPSPGALGVLERCHAAVRPSEHLCAVVRREDNDGVVGDPYVVDMLQQGADTVIQLRHAGFLKTIVRLAVLHRAVFF